MTRPLESFIEKVAKAWGPLTSATVVHCRTLLEELARDPAAKTWLIETLRGSESGKELYRDPSHGFVLFAYTESQGQYRAPHDHGSGWVLYALQSGELEMGTYGRVIDQRGKLRLVNRETYRMQAGDCRVFLPSDIHDTRCISDSVRILRLTSCDLKKEDLEGRMIRYLE